MPEREPVLSWLLQEDNPGVRGDGPLIGYFLRRRLFYRTDDPTRLVLDDHPGRRMTDAFFPIEYFRVGLPVLLDALAVLGAGEAPA